MYTGFQSSSSQSFYSVYGSLFLTLESEEEDAFLEFLSSPFKDSSMGVQDFVTTSFGDENSGFDSTFIIEFRGIQEKRETSLKEFYSKWSNFSTLKPFSWCDKVKHVEQRDEEGGMLRGWKRE